MKMRNFFIAIIGVQIFFSSIVMADERRFTILPDSQKRNPIHMDFSPIDKVKLPNYWPFETNSNLLQENKKRISERLVSDFSLSKNQFDKCKELSKKLGSYASYYSCIETVGFHFLATRDTRGIGDILIDLSSRHIKTYTVKSNDFSSSRYQTRGLITVLASFYAFYFDDFLFSDDERSQVNDFFRIQLRSLNMDEVGEANNQVFCDPRNQSNIGVNKKGRADINTCGSNRWKATIAQLLLGIRLKHEELFRRGIYNTKFMLLAFDNEGIFVPWATRGALSIHYSNEIPRFLAQLTEIFYSIGYDFLNHELENGLTVKELFDTYFNIYQDKTILDKYSVRQYAQKGENYQSYLSRSTKDELAKWSLTLNAFARESMRYIQDYRKDLYHLVDCNYNPRQTNGEPNRLISSFSIIDNYELYLANFSEQNYKSEFCYSKFSDNKQKRHQIYSEKYIAHENTWTIRENIEGAKLEFSIPFETIPFEQLTQSISTKFEMDDEIYAETVELKSLNDKRLSVRWHLTQKNNPKLLKLVKANERASQHCGYIHRPMWGENWKRLVILLSTDDEYDLEYQVCHFEIMNQELSEDELRIYLQLIELSSSIFINLTTRASSVGSWQAINQLGFENIDGFWRAQKGIEALTIVDFEKAVEPISKPSVGRAALHLKIGPSKFPVYADLIKPTDSQVGLRIRFAESVTPFDKAIEVVDRHCNGAHRRLWKSTSETLDILYQTDNEYDVEHQICVNNHMLSSLDENAKSLFEMLVSDAQVLVKTLGQDFNFQQYKKDLALKYIAVSYEMKEGLWNIKQGVQDANVKLVDRATVDFRPPVVNRGFVSLTNQFGSQSAATELVQTEKNDILIRWYIGETTDFLSPETKEKIERLYQECKEIFYTETEYNSNYVQFLVKGNDLLSLAHQACLLEHMTNLTPQSDLTKLNFIKNSSLGISKVLDPNFVPWSNLFEKNNGLWVIKTPEKMPEAKIEFIKLKEPIQENVWRRAFVKIVTPETALEEGIRVFNFDKFYDGKPERILAWYIGDDAIPPMNGFLEINKKIDEKCGGHFSIPNNYLAFVVQTNYEENLLLQSCFYEQYSKIDDQEIRNMYSAILSQVPEIYLNLQ